MVSRAFNMKRSLEAIETSVAAATTIAARMPILLTAAVSGSPRAMIEAQRMVTEKAQAAAEGALAAGTAWTRMWMRLGLGMLQPHELPEAVAKVVDAACGPAARACRQNARRLTRRPAARKSASGKRRR